MNPTVTDATARTPGTSPVGTPDQTTANTGTSGRKVIIRIRRMDGPARPETARWEEFAVPHRPNMNIISCLQYIAAYPVTTDGKQTTPPVWDSGCLEEVCGACTMVINGKTRQSCSALVDRLGEPGEPITLEPMSKFPVVRDLFVDRQRLFNDLKKAKAWVPIDGTYDLGPGPAVPQKLQEKRYPLSRCISCGCCLEACPQYLPETKHAEAVAQAQKAGGPYPEYQSEGKFVGAAVVSQVRLFNDDPTGAALKEERLDAMMGEGGVADCGKAGNCVEVCPKEIPLLESIAAVQRQATVYTIKRFFAR